MILIPAVDILDGKCVRLLRGRRGDVTVYGDPLEFALKWADAGAKRLHIVDLNGAFDGGGPPGGNGVNLGIIRKIAFELKKRGVQIQNGGGIRGVERAREVTEAGVDYIILGTAACYDKEFALECAREFPGRVIGGIDCKDGFVSVKGWQETTRITGEALARDLKRIGVNTVVFTDISRDGAMSGVNVEACAKLQKTAKINVIASGGVRDAGDLKKLSAAGVYGAILGKSLYEGTIDLKEEIARYMEY